MGTESLRVKQTCTDKLKLNLAANIYVDASLATVSMGHNYIGIYTFVQNATV